jgi:hypothetical protein
VLEVEEQVITVGIMEVTLVAQVAGVGVSVIKTIFL